jgi:hypothetical protein
VSIRLLNAWQQGDPIIHTAVDDLESFLWLLCWVLVHILKKYGTKHQGILNVESTLSSKDMVTNVTKEYFMERSWPDVVFGNLMRDWLRILTLARHEVEQFMSKFSMILAIHDRLIAFNDLELLCYSVYGKILESGFSRREEISRYSKWEDVIQAMTPSRHW